MSTRTPAAGQKNGGGMITINKPQTGDFERNLPRETCAECKRGPTHDYEEITGACPVVCLFVAVTKARVARGTPDRFGDLVIADHLVGDADCDHSE